jgi:hypothetical protein
MLAYHVFVEAQVKKDIAQVPDSKKKNMSYQTVAGKVSATTLSVKSFFLLTCGFSGTSINK